MLAILILLGVGWIVTSGALAFVLGRVIQLRDENE